MLCFFVSDLHGDRARYETLFAHIAAERPAAVFLGGDLLPMPMDRRWALELGRADFVADLLASGFEALSRTLGNAYPRVFLILGNDDARIEEAALRAIAARGLWRYVHAARSRLGEHPVYGYSHIPPSPFLLKDWERYDVSRFVDPGCVSPEEGRRTVPVAAHELRYGTIQKDLELLVGNDELEQAIFLFHAPPYETPLDRAALDGRRIDHVPLDVHIGSIAIERFIRARQPLLTLHGHVHEAERLTGTWRTRIGRTHVFSAAHDGPELALVRFDPARLEQATRELC